MLFFKDIFQSKHKTFLFVLIVQEIKTANIFSAN